MIAFEYVLHSSPVTREAVIMKVQEFSKRHEEVYGNDLWAEFSFGHIVISDYNLDDDFIKMSLRQFMIDEWVQGKIERNMKNVHDYYPVAVIEAARDEIIIFLRWLLTIPEDIREGEYEDEQD